MKRSTLCTLAQINQWAASSTSVTPQVRSLRKGNTDQVAIAIDMDPASSSSRLEDEDDDKGKILNSRGYDLLAFQLFPLPDSFYELIVPLILLPYSAWFQVISFIKNCSKILKTCDRHDRWTLVGHTHILFRHLNI